MLLSTHKNEHAWSFTQWTNWSVLQGGWCCNKLLIAPKHTSIHLFWSFNDSCFICWFTYQLIYIFINSWIYPLFMEWWINLYIDRMIDLENAHIFVNYLYYTFMYMKIQLKYMFTHVYTCIYHVCTFMSVLQRYSYHLYTAYIPCSTSQMSKRSNSTNSKK